MTSQYGAHELHAGKARLYTRIRMHTPTLPGTRTHERAPTHKYVIFIAFPRQQWFANAPVCYVMRTLSFWMSNLAATRKHFSLCPFTTPRHCDWATFIVKRHKWIISLRNSSVFWVITRHEVVSITSCHVKVPDEGRIQFNSGAVLRCRRSISVTCFYYDFLFRFSGGSSWCSGKVSGIIFRKWPARNISRSFHQTFWLWFIMGFPSRMPMCGFKFINFSTFKPNFAVK